MGDDPLWLLRACAQPQSTPWISNLENAGPYRTIAGAAQLSPVTWPHWIPDLLLLSQTKTKIRGNSSFYLEKLMISPIKNSLLEAQFIEYFIGWHFCFPHQGEVKFNT